MSPGNQGVFQFLKELTFRRIMTFWSSWEGCLLCLIGWWDWFEKFLYRAIHSNRKPEH